MRRIEPYISALALMGLNFFLSAQPDLNSGLGTIDLIGRKIVHALLYAALCLLWWRALRQTPLGPRRAVPVAVVIAVAYAATDEFHQTFVRGREGAVHDVAIDALGAVLMAVVLWHRGRAADREPGRAV